MSPGLFEVLELLGRDNVTIAASPGRANLPPGLTDPTQNCQLAMPSPPSRPGWASFSQERQIPGVHSIRTEMPLPVGTNVPRTEVASQIFLTPFTAVTLARQSFPDRSLCRVALWLHWSARVQKTGNVERDRTGDEEEDNVAKEDRGFASMDRAKQREIASKGGKAAHQKGTAHEWTSEEARDAGRKGGIASHQRRREQSGPGSEDEAQFRVPNRQARRRRRRTSSPGEGTVEQRSHAGDYRPGIPLPCPSSFLPGNFLRVVASVPRRPILAHLSRQLDRRQVPRLYDRVPVKPEDYARARRLLLRRDPILAALIGSTGPCGLAAAQRSDHFSALVRAITGQQLSTKAAATIYARLAALMPGGVTPESLSALSDEQFRAVGMSRQKSAYFRDLCRKGPERRAAARLARVDVRR